MRVYPKGCRYILVNGGEVSEMTKTTRRADVRSLVLHPSHGECWLVVQPRGKKKWWLFHNEPQGWSVMPQFVTTAYEPDSLVMRALLSN